MASLDLMRASRKSPICLNMVPVSNDNSFFGPSQMTKRIIKIEYSLSVFFSTILLLIGIIHFARCVLASCLFNSQTKEPILI